MVDIPAYALGRFRPSVKGSTDSVEKIAPLSDLRKISVSAKNNGAVSGGQERRFLLWGNANTFPNEAGKGEGLTG